MRITSRQLIKIIFFDKKKNFFNIFCTFRRHSSSRCWTSSLWIYNEKKLDLNFGFYTILIWTFDIEKSQIMLLQLELICIINYSDFPLKISEFKSIMMKWGTYLIRGNRKTNSFLCWMKNANFYQTFPDTCPAFCGVLNMKTQTLLELKILYSLKYENILRTTIKVPYKPKVTLKLRL